MNKQESKENLRLIVMDCNMPIMDGFEAAKEIMEKIVDEHYVPCGIVGYTALIGEDEARNAKESGMVDLLQKPAAFKDLRTKIFANLDKI